MKFDGTEEVYAQMPENVVFIVIHCAIVFAHLDIRILCLCLAFALDRMYMSVSCSVHSDTILTFL